MSSSSTDFKSKARTSKKVRSILNRYHVDWEFLRLQTNKNSILLYGCLLKTDGSDFKATVLKQLIDDLVPHGRVQSELMNWCLNGSVRKIEVPE